MHDLHHVATGYGTDVTGEAELAAWELAAGCGRYPAAWVYNGMAMALGLAIAPRKTVRAFARGRRGTTLYVSVPLGPLLELSVNELREQLALE